MWPDVGLGTGEGARGWPLYITSVVMVIIAGLFVVPRYIWRYKTNFLDKDDHLILASLITSVILTITEVCAVENGYGRHYDELPKDRATVARKWFFGAQIAYKTVLVLNKSSICSMYYRIFWRRSKSFRICCHIMQAFIVASGIAFIVGAVFQCTPVAAFWDPAQPHRCFNQTAWWLSYSVIQIVTDFLLLALPIRQVLLLNMTPSDKVGLILVFCLGLITTLTSILRATTLASSAKYPDPTYGPIPATVWTVIEANMGIITACLPILRRPFAQLFSKLESLFKRVFMPKRTAVPIAPAGPRRYTGGHSANRTVDISSPREDRNPMYESKQSICVTNDIHVDIEQAADASSTTNLGRFDAE